MVFPNRCGRLRIDWKIRKRAHLYEIAKVAYIFGLLYGFSGSGKIENNEKLRKHNSFLMSTIIRNPIYRSVYVISLSFTSYVVFDS